MRPHEDPIRAESRAKAVAALLVLAAGCRASPPTDAPPSVDDGGAATTMIAPMKMDAALSLTDPLDADTDGDAWSSLDAGDAYICFPPMAGDFDRCPKGAMAGEDALRACLQRRAAAPARHPVFRVGDRPLSAFSKTRWRCAPVSLDTKVHVTIDTIAGLDVIVSRACPSRAFDMIGPNFYGAVFFRCSTRTRRDDEELSGD